MRRVALLIETSRTYGRDLLAGIRRYVDENGEWSMYLELRGLDSRPPAWLHRWKGDGILSRTGSKELSKALQRTNAPVVELRTSRFHHSFPFVGVDNRALGRTVADHLLNLGFQNFGIYRIDTEDYFIERAQNFVDYLVAKGNNVAEFHEIIHEERPFVWERHQDQLVRWLKQLPKPAGVMACTDQLGYWLIDACRRAGISVPHEVAVVGAENDETLCSTSSPPLSSVEYDGALIGYTAAKVLDGMMNGEEAPSEPILIPPRRISTRQSSDVVATNDPHLAQAIRMIRDKATTGLSVQDILRVVPISRSTLERRMRELLGRSPREEILRLRLDSAKHLLSGTDLTIDQISHRTGFQTVQYFCTVFQKELQTTPGSYRKRSRTGSSDAG